MERLEFEVKGSQPTPYRILFEASDGGIKAFCTCMSGKKGGSVCKHRLGLMDGDVSNLVSDNTGDVNRLRELIAGSPLAASYKRVIKARELVQAAEAELKSANQTLSQMMRD